MTDADLIAQLRGENSRLRQALEKILEMTAAAVDVGGDFECARCHVRFTPKRRGTAFGPTKFCSSGCRAAHFRACASADGGSR